MELSRPLLYNFMVYCLFAPYKLAHGPNNGPMSNCYNFQPVGPMTGCSFSDIYPEYYSEVMMSTMATQITGVSIVVWSFVLAQIKESWWIFRHKGLVTENVSIWWRRHWGVVFLQMLCYWQISSVPVVFCWIDSLINMFYLLIQTWLSPFCLISVCNRKHGCN